MTWQLFTCRPPIRHCRWLRYLQESGSVSTKYSVVTRKMCLHLQWPAAAADSSPAVWVTGVISVCRTDSFQLWKLMLSCLSVLFVYLSCLSGHLFVCLLSACVSAYLYVCRWPEQSREVLSSFRSFCRQAADVSGATGATGCQSQRSTAQPLQRGRWGDVPVQVQHRQRDVTLFVGRHVERQWLRLWTWVPPAVELSSYSIWKYTRSVWATQLLSIFCVFCLISALLLFFFVLGYSFKLTVY